MYTQLVKACNNVIVLYIVAKRIILYQSVSVRMSLPFITVYFAGKRDFWKEIVSELPSTVIGENECWSCWHEAPRAECLHGATAPRNLNSECSIIIITY